MKLLGICAAVVVAAVTYNAVTTPPRAPTPKPAIAQSLQPLPPLRTAVFLDLSDSRNLARITVSVDDLAPLFDRLRTRGGEIGFGSIREESDTPLIRCYVPTPPEPPAPVPVAGNVFVAANARKREESERKKYEAKRRAWEADATARINAFIAAITPIVNAAAHAPATDVTDALVRGDLMLAEPSPFAHPATASIVLITDGIHNATKTTVTTLRSNARVVVVNGVAAMGVLEQLTPTPIRFESTAAAIRYITTEGEPDVR